VQLAFVGPPTINIEAKLAEVNDEVVEGGSDPVGVLFVRGPPVGKELNVTREDASGEDGGDWVSIGERAKIYPNGTFKVLTRST
jgi:long-chain acyl-CoA synthetase